MIVVFLDANVLFSAVYRPQSAPGLLIDFAEAGYIGAVSSAFAIEEARRNLSLKATGSGTTAWTRVQRVCACCRSPGAEALGWAATQTAEKDAPILAAAVEAKCDWLVTGDRRDFGHLFGGSPRGVLVVPPSDALQRLIVLLQARP